MAVNLTIDGVDIPVIIQSLSTTLQTGLSGCQLTGQICSLNGFVAVPTPTSKVELTLGGLTFLCRLGHLDHVPHTQYVTYNLTAYGPQERLKRPAPPLDYRTDKHASSIANDLVSGSGITASVPNDVTVSGGFQFSGSVGDAAIALANRAGLILYLSPDGILYFYDREHLPAAPFDWIITTSITTIDLRSLHKTTETDLPITQVTIHGSVKKNDPGDPDTETRTISSKGDGVNQWFDYPNVTDRVTDVRKNSTSQTITFFGDGSAGSKDCVNYRQEYRIFFNTAPADGDLIEIDLSIQRAQATVNDTSSQTALSTNFSGWDGVVSFDNQDMNIRTQSEAMQQATSTLAALGLTKRQATAISTNINIFLPGHKVVVSDSRDSAWTDTTLFVLSNNLKWKSGLNRWEQSITVGNGEANSGGSSGGLGNIAQAITGPIKQSKQTKPPPTETSAANPYFDLSIDPATQSVWSESSGGLDFTITVTPHNGFTGDVVFECSLFASDYTVVFVPATITDSGDTICTITPVVPWNIANSPLDFSILGSSGEINSSVNGSITIDDSYAGASVTYSDDFSTAVPVGVDPWFGCPGVCIATGASADITWQITVSGAANPAVDGVVASGVYTLVKSTRTAIDPGCLTGLETETGPDIHHTESVILSGTEYSFPITYQSRCGFILLSL